MLAAGECVETAEAGLLQVGVVGSGGGAGAAALRHAQAAPHVGVVPIILHPCSKQRKSIIHKNIKLV